MNRQKVILFVLLIILGLSLLYAYLSTPDSPRVETSAGSGTTVASGGSSRAGTLSAVDPNKVKLAMLDRDKMKYKGYKRDIFNFYVAKPKPAPPKPAIKQPLPKPVVKPPPVVTPQVRKQLAKFTFLGFLIKNEERTVFLSKREDLFLVRNGESFGESNEFEVIAITDALLTIRQSGASGQIEIPLVEKEPLIPSFSSGESSGSNEGQTVVNQNPGTPAARSSVPPQEQRKQWFRKTQEPPEQ